MHTQVHLILFVQLILLTPWLLINALKHTLLTSIECDYCPMQHRIINLCYITIVMRRSAYLFPLRLLHTHSHWRWKTATGWSHADFKEGTLWRHIPALISLPKLLCSTYTQIKITKQKHSKFVIIIVYDRCSTSRSREIPCASPWWIGAFGDGSQHGVVYGKRLRSARKRERLQFDSCQILACESAFF